MKLFRSTCHLDAYMCWYFAVKSGQFNSCWCAFPLKGELNGQQLIAFRKKQLSAITHDNAAFSSCLASVEQTSPVLMVLHKENVLKVYNHWRLSLRPTVFNSLQNLKLHHGILLIAVDGNKVCHCPPQQSVNNCVIIIHTLCEHNAGRH